MAQPILTEVPRPDPAGPALLEVRDLTKWYPLGRSLVRFGRHAEQTNVRAVDGVSFRLVEGECLGLAGESGSGKTVTAEILAKLQAPTTGTIWFRGQDVTRLRGPELMEFRRQVQMVFQNPFDCLNSRLRVAQIVREPLIIHRLGTADEQMKRVQEMLTVVGLQPAEYYMERFPHQLSGGERQRVAIARALVLEPKLLIADEPTTMLDVSVRAGILNLFRQLQQQFGLSILFISHDFSTLRYICHSTAIMYLGRIVELGPTEQVLSKRYHPYTDALADSIPHPDPGAHRPPARITGEIPPSTQVFSGCRFASRCPYATADCRAADPPAVDVAEGYRSACIIWQDRPLSPEQADYRQRVAVRQIAH